MKAPQPMISYHLRSLASCGLVTGASEGAFRIYSLAAGTKRDGEWLTIAGSLRVKLSALADSN
jgi:hypothetical protein